MSSSNVCLGDCCDVTIARFEHYPRDEPDSYVIGYTVSCKSNGKSIFRDTRIMYADAQGKTDDQIAKMGWSNIKLDIECWYDSVKDKTPLVGSNLNIFEDDETCPI